MRAAISNRIPELDALRGIAVVQVLLLHITTENGKPNGLFTLGSTGVDLFFVISGFVILMTLERTKTWQDFVVSRFARLYPTYWVSVISVAVLMLINSIICNEPITGLTTKFLANLTMMQTYFKVLHLDGTYWTLQVEMLFYLFMLGVFLTNNLKRIEIFATLTLLPVFGYHLLLNTRFQGLHAILSNYLPLLNHFPLFFAGILFYKMKFEQVNWTRYGLIVLCFVLQYIMFFDGGFNKYYISQTEYGGMLIIYFGIFILYVANKLGFIVNRITLFLGGISYSLYLMHSYIGTDFLVPNLIEYANLSFGVASLGIALPVTLILSILTNRYIEKPVTQYIRMQYKKKIGLAG